MDRDFPVAERRSHEQGATLQEPVSPSYPPKPLDPKRDWVGKAKKKITALPGFVWVIWCQIVP